MDQKNLNQKGFTPIIILIIIVLVIIGGGVLLWNRLNEDIVIVDCFPGPCTKQDIEQGIERIKRIQEESQLKVYKSILGYSFEKPADLTVTVQESSCNIEKIKENPYSFPPIQANDYVSVIYNKSFQVIVVDYKKTNKSMSEKQLESLPGGCSKYYEDIQTQEVNQIEALFADRKLLKDTRLGSYSTHLSLNHTTYQNNKSGLYGIAFFSMGGYNEPGFDKYKTFYLLTKDKKYLIELKYQLSCTSLDEIEKKFQDKNITFNPQEYESAIIGALPACDQEDSKQKSDAILFLDSFKYN